MKYAFIISGVHLSFWRGRVNFERTTDHGSAV
jgi:hypothetical protein